MLKLLKCFGFGLLVLVTGCGQKGAPSAPWPASVKFDKLSETQKQSVSEMLMDFSKDIGTETFYFDNRSAQFQLTITLLGDQDQKSSKAGLATYNGSYCLLELSPLVFEESYQSYLQPVLWHELGHCAGMEHDKSVEEIMYYLARPKGFYSDSAISHFFNSFTSLTSLISK
ncbi:MAG: hypothetical protein ACKOA8_14880 [Deltaproteobacteria bacterium]